MCNALGDLLPISERLWRVHQTVRQKKLDFKAADSYAAVTRHRTPLDAVRFKGLFMQSKKTLSDVKNRASTKKPRSDPTTIMDITAEQRFILPPLDDDSTFVPVLELKYSILEKTNVFALALRVAMVCCFAADAGKRETLAIAGFRFETGEQDSNHFYYHVQPTPPPFEGLPLEYGFPTPKTYPCIPLPAVDPVSLLVALLASFYGINGLAIIAPELKLEGLLLKPVMCLMSQERVPCCRTDLTTTLR